MYMKTEPRVRQLGQVTRNSVPTLQIVKRNSRHRAPLQGHDRRYAHQTNKNVKD